MPRIPRFSLAGLLLWVALFAIVSAIVAPFMKLFQQGARYVTSLAMSADGSTVAALWSDGTARVWDVRGNQLAEIATTPGPYGGEIAMSADGSLLAVLPESSPLEIWDVGARRKLPLAAPPRGTAFALSPTEPLAAVCDSSTAPASITLYSWDTPDRSPTPVITGKNPVADALAFSPDGRTLAVGSAESRKVAGTIDFLGKVELYNVERRSLSTEFTVASGSIVGPFALCFSPDGHSLAVLAESAVNCVGRCSLEAHDTATGRLMATLPPPYGGSGNLTYLPGSIVLAHAAGVLEFWDVRSQTRLASPAPSDDWTQFIAAGREGAHFATARTDMVRLWDVATLQPQRVLWDESVPFPWLPYAALAIWLLVWGARRRRNLRRTCQTCGKPFTPTNKKDTNVECPLCRALRQRFTMTPKQRRKQNRRAILVGFCAWAPFALGIAGAMTAWLNDRWHVPFAPTFTIGFVGWFVGFPLAAAAAVLVKLRYALRRQNRQANDLALAERCAGAAGRIEVWNDSLLWWAASEELAGDFKRAWNEAQSRLTEFAGHEVPPCKPVRVLGFDRRAAMAQYSATYLLTRSNSELAATFVSSPVRKIVVCEATLGESSIDPAVDLRGVSMIAMLDAGNPKGRPYWLCMASRRRALGAVVQRAARDREMTAGFGIRWTMHFAILLLEHKKENTMKDTETITEQQADEEAVNEHVLTGKPLDPEVYRRVRARADKITAELRRKYGVMNVSADLIREVRDEE